MESAPCQVTHAGNSVTVIDLTPFRALLTADDAPPQGMTSTQLQAAMGINHMDCRDMLRAAHEQGRLIRDSWHDPNHFSGKRIKLTVYRWRGEEDEA